MDKFFTLAECKILCYFFSKARGARNCTLRKPCTEQDYYDIRTACDSEHKVCVLWLMAAEFFVSILWASNLFLEKWFFFYVIVV